MIIAYNLCYSTILGKFDPKTGGSSGRLGVLPYSEAKTSGALARAEEAHESWERKRGRETPGVEFAAKETIPRAPHSAAESARAFHSQDSYESHSSAYDGTASSRTSGDGEVYGRSRVRWDPRCIHVSANAAGFCHPSLRQGVLPVERDPGYSGDDQGSYEEGGGGREEGAGEDTERAAVRAQDDLQRHLRVSRLLELMLLLLLLLEVVCTSVRCNAMYH